MNSLTRYIKDSYIELTEKVTWPTFKELQSSSLVVLVATVIFAVVVYLMDMGITQITKAVYDILS